VDVAVEDQPDQLAAGVDQRLPELPPTMSLFVERLKGVFGSSRGFACSQRSGILNGSAPVARS